ncbi:FAD-dependent hydroxylase [Spirulina subsalsa FACHB-351]|uniref:FAD-dependent hydroxylase n=1 Tax=Spirulina subsalsa FACHB-351 TaxID=234711 RepID=A0ABT3L9Q4_9CYAN|nr:FAD-dependent hydroxylase [Spirulina subsalsa]MCW6038243.1 FAD-dependent hydroxylase [Spirulina subsalsa FACHB-351]
MTFKEFCDREFDADLAVVGGGIVGATLAAALKGSGLRVVIIEAQSPAQAKARQRAYALSLLSGRIFEGIGVWGQMLPQIAQFKQISLSDADYPEIVHFRPEELATGALGYVGEHSVVLGKLQGFLAGAENVQWLCPGQLVEVEESGEGINLTVELGEERRRLRTRLVVGADGARSPLRSWAGIKTKGWKYWQSCVTFTIRHDQPENETAYERFWYSGPMGILPLPGNRCQVVWTAPHGEAKALQGLDTGEFLERFRERTAGVLGTVELVGDRFLFPVQLMQCDRYIQNRFALIGDAAHCCHPVGGQGLNLGIRDAAALAQVLQEAQAQGEDIGSIAVLQRYEQWRRRENWVILGFTDFLDRMFSTPWWPVVTVRRWGILLLKHIRPLKLFALQLMTGLKGRAPQLARSN